MLGGDLSLRHPSDAWERVAVLLADQVAAALGDG
jgi:hypothetical protein